MTTTPRLSIETFHRQTQRRTFGLATEHRQHQDISSCEVSASITVHLMVVRIFRQNECHVLTGIVATVCRQVVAFES